MNKTHFFSILLVCSFIFTLSCNSNNSPADKENDIIPPPELGFYTEDYVSDTTVVKNGDTFAGIMNRLGMNSRDTYTLTQMCDSIIDLRKIRMGNKLYAFYEPTDSSRILRYVVYEHNRIHSTVFQCSDSLAIWNVDKEVVNVRKSGDITIESSLWNDMIAAGVSPILIMDLADIFQWSVNFFTLQKGDRFRVIYTQSECEGELISIDTVHFSLFNPTSGREVAAVRFQIDESGRSTFWDKGGESLKRMFLKAPLKYNRISSRFTYSRKHPISGVVKPHTGVDYAAPTGTPVQAIGDGTVTMCGWDSGGGGNRIRIKHMRGYESSYMHLSKFASGIKQGTRVSQGQTIGYVGSTGSSTGPHLDFRIWENGRPIDPLKLDSPASEPLDQKYLEAFNSLYDSYMAEVLAWEETSEELEITE